MAIIGASKVDRRSAAAFTSANPTLADGIEGVETGTGFRKMGDGATAWTALSYSPDHGGDFADTLVEDAAFTAKYAPLAYAQAGSGAPNGVVTGSVGDRYVDTAETLGARVWYKASGTATNTGWLVAEGDTGWRSLTVVNGWTGTVLIRRVDYSVQMQFDALNDSASTSDVFVSDNDLLGFLFKNAAASVVMPWSVSGGVVREVTMTETAGSPSTFSIPRSAFATTLASASGTRNGPSWLTELAWPSALPGSAA